MTEDDAKMKWCPFARIGSEQTGLGSLNRDSVRGVQLAQARCIASACMAWRWSEGKRSAAFLEAVRAHMGSEAKPNFNASVQAVYAERGEQFERVEGRCGLAGASQ